MHYTTLYKTAIRATSQAGACNYVVLNEDPDQLVFKDNNGAVPPAALTPPFKGDMSFYGPRDKIEALSKVTTDAMSQLQGHNTNGLVIANTFSLNRIYGVTNAQPSMVNPSQVPYDTNFKIAYGKNQYNLFIKSAITGSNVNIVVYKCKARYSIPQLAQVLSSQGASSNTQANAAFAALTGTEGANNQVRGFFNSVQNIHAIGWAMNFKGSVDANNQGNTVADFDNATEVVATAWTRQQEGTSLYDNKIFCQLFQITKTYKAELVPGQMAKIALRTKKHSMINPIKDAIGGSYLCTKGQTFFVLKLQGSLGHEDLSDTVGGLQTQKFYDGVGARPKIGIMPAAVDVMCFKKFKVACHYKPRSKIKNIVTYGDYYDEQQTAGGAPPLPDFFIDSAPSDYTASAAVIN